MGYNQPSFHDMNSTYGAEEVYLGSSATVDVYGDIDLESGCSVEFKSGSNLDMASGSTLNLSNRVDLETGSSMEVKTGAYLEFESGSVLNLESGAKFYQGVQSLTTASTGTSVNPSGITLIKSTKTAKTLTMGTPSVGMIKTIYCTAATATKIISVRVGSTGRTFDGANWIYAFKKADQYVQFFCGSTGRLYEIIRSSADGTAIASTST